MARNGNKSNKPNANNKPNKFDQLLPENLANVSSAMEARNAAERKPDSSTEEPSLSTGDSIVKTVVSSTSSINKNTTDVIPTEKTPPTENVPAAETTLRTDQKNQTPNCQIKRDSSSWSMCSAIHSRGVL